MSGVVLANKHRGAVKVGLQKGRSWLRNAGHLGFKCWSPDFAEQDMSYFGHDVMMSWCHDRSS